MTILFKEPIACEPIPWELPGSVLVSSGAMVGEKSPTIDFNVRQYSADEIGAFVTEFVKFYYGVKDASSLDSVRFIDDLERYVYTLGNQLPLEYGKSLCNPQDIEHHGMSDKGMTHYLFLQDITDAMGMDLSTQGGEGGEMVDKLSESNTVGEFIDNLVALLEAHGPFKR